MKNEVSRLSTLKSLNILDTDPETRFDRLTRLAKRMFDVPIALVSLVDEDRQWFKSCVGLDVTETPRDISFCQHTIKDNVPLIVEDATKHELFSDNPLVTDEPYIRFYAGIPVKAINGDNLGTFCIIDIKPRELTQNDIEALLDLAKLAERELNISELALYDDLTILLNRCGFIDRATEGLKLCKRYGVSASMVYIDLDNFKSINDQLGHKEGDKVLKIFSYSITETFRNTDIFSRLGGDEFVLLLHNTTKDQVNNIIEQFTCKLDNNCDKENLTYKIEFSYGVLEVDTTGDINIETLLHSSDAIMYKHKEFKRNQILDRAR